MAKWRVNRNGPEWLMDNIGRLIGYRDRRGGEHKIPQLSGAWGDAESSDAPVAGVGLENQALVDGAGISFLRGALESGSWATVPSIFRLRLTGTGTVVMDSRDSLGVETLAVESYTLAGATNQIEVLYAGDAVAIRITLSGTAAAEVI